MAKMQRNVWWHIVVWIPATDLAYRNAMPDINFTVTLRITGADSIFTGYLHEVFACPVVMIVHRHLENSQDMGLFTSLVT